MNSVAAKQARDFLRITHKAILQLEPTLHPLPNEPLRALVARAGAAGRLAVAWRKCWEAGRVLRGKPLSVSAPTKREKEVKEKRKVRPAERSGELSGRLAEEPGVTEAAKSVTAGVASVQLPDSGETVASHNETVVVVQKQDSIGTVVPQNETVEVQQKSPAG